MERKEKEKKNHLCVLHHHLLELLQTLWGLSELPLLPKGNRGVLERHVLAEKLVNIL